MVNHNAPPGNDNVPFVDGGHGRISHEASATWSDENNQNPQVIALPCPELTGPFPDEQPGPVSIETFTYFCCLN